MCGAVRAASATCLAQAARCSTVDRPRPICRQDDALRKSPRKASGSSPTWTCEGKAAAVTGEGSGTGRLEDEGRSCEGCGALVRPTGGGGSLANTTEIDGASSLGIVKAGGVLNNRDDNSVALTMTPSARANDR